MASLASGGQKRTCLYELLEVPRDVSPGQLKKAYYLVARVHHPDKRGNTKEATAYFQEIQHAYEVLSDKNERAWYDAHREEILRGGTGGDDDNADSFADELDLTKFPTPGPFSLARFTKFGVKFFKKSIALRGKLTSVRVKLINIGKLHCLETRPPLEKMSYYFTSGGLDSQRGKPSHGETSTTLLRQKIVAFGV